MTKKYLLTAIVLLLGLTSNAYAGCDDDRCVTVKLETIYVASGTTFIKTDGIESDLDNCTPDTGVFVTLDHAHSAADKIYAMLLTAYTGQLNVTTRFNDTSGGSGLCSIQYAILEGN